MDTNYWIVAVLFAAAAVLSVFGLLGKRRHEAGREAVSVQMLLDDPLVRQWLDTHLTGEHAGDIRAIREQFGLVWGWAMRPCCGTHTEAVSGSLKAAVPSPKRKKTAERLI